MAKSPLTREELEQTVLFMATEMRELRLQLAEETSLVGALLDTLTAAGLVPLADLERRRRLSRNRLIDEMRDYGRIMLETVEDKYQVKSPDVDCAALIPICHGRCCKLQVCLSRQDLDEGHLAWNHERPYALPKRPDGLCVYSEPETHFCGTYQHRPASCRSYDCREDPRIWKDFANRIPAD